MSADMAEKLRASADALEQEITKALERDPDRDVSEGQWRVQDLRAAADRHQCNAAAQVSDAVTASPPYPVVCLVHYDKHALAEPPPPPECDPHLLQLLNFYSHDEAEEWLTKQIALVNEQRTKREQ